MVFLFITLTWESKWVLLVYFPETWASLTKMDFWWYGNKSMEKFEGAFTHNVIDLLYLLEYVRTKVSAVWKFFFTSVSISPLFEEKEFCSDHEE